MKNSRPAGRLRTIWTRPSITHCAPNSAGALERAIALLPEDMRSAVVLRDIQGCAYDEIADILGTNVGTIKSRISRGRARLREILLQERELFDRANV